jgi:hypothetical protein
MPSARFALTALRFAQSPSPRTASVPAFTICSFFRAVAKNNAPFINKDEAVVCFWNGGMDEVELRQCTFAEFFA